MSDDGVKDLRDYWKVRGELSVYRRNIEIAKDRWRRQRGDHRVIDDPKLVRNVLFVLDQI